MKKINLLVWSMLLPLFIFAKTSAVGSPIVPSGNIINRAIDKYRDDKGADAILHLDSIHPADTNYVWSVYLKSLVNLSIKEYQKCIDAGEKVLKLDPNYSYNDYTYNLISKAYDRLGNHEKALEYFDKCLEFYPLSAMTYHNRGTSHARANNHEKAVAELQEAIRINPNYARSHRTLGRWAAKEKKTTMAFLSLLTSMLVDPVSTDTRNTLVFLNDTLLCSDYAYKPTGTFISASSENVFTTLDKALQSRVALGSKYKTPSKITLNLVKQTHLLLENLGSAYKATDKGFWMQTYVPIFLEIQQTKQFSYAAIYSLLSISTSASIKKELDKNEAKVKIFGEWYRKKWTDAFSKLDYKNKSYDVSRSTTTGAVIKIGTITNGTFSGPGFEFGSKGNLTAYGDFNNDLHNNKWIVTNISGLITTEITYKDNVLHGNYTAYYDNGNKKSEGSFTEGLKTGLIKAYYETGELYSEVNYDKNYYDGIYKEYYKIGAIKYEISYKAGIKSGALKEYYYNGNLARSQTHVDGKLDGKSTYYYLDGQEKSVFNFVNGNIQGEYVRYYAHGKTEEKGQYTDGSQSGKIQYFYPDGTLREEKELDETGKYTGINKEYTHDGILNNEFEYKKGEITAFRYFDKNGNIIKSGERKKGRFEYAGVYHDGILSAEGTFESGETGKVGVWTYYDKNGNLSAKETFNDKGQKDGIRYEYYPSGQLESELNYTNGQKNGYYVGYFLNGTVSSEGWYQNDLREGIWQEFYENGRLESETYYIKGSSNGTVYYYSETGILKSTSLRKDGLTLSQVYFDSLGNQISTLVYGGPQKASITFIDGSKMSMTLVSDVYHGPVEWHDAMGLLDTKGQYENDERHGEWTWYYDNGKISSKGSYVNGEKHGIWTDYYESGKVEQTEEYVFGLLNGKKIQYYENGAVEIEETFNYGDKSGIRYFYSPEGKLQLARHYVDDKMTGYQYHLPSGKLCDFIPLPNETGFCESKYDNGKTARSFTVEKGLFQGEYIKYHYNGNLFSKSIYKNDELEGAFKQYYASGKIEIERNYKNGLAVGQEKIYHENGQIKSTCRYINGAINGILRTYNTSGKLIKEERYFLGEKISEKTF